MLKIMKLFYHMHATSQDMAQQAQWEMQTISVSFRQILCNNVFSD